MSKYTDRRVWMQTATQQKLDNLRLTEATVNKTKAIYRQATKDIERQVESIYKQFGALDKANKWNFKGLDKPATRKDATALMREIDKAGLTEYIPENLSKKLSVIQAKQLSNWLTLQRAGQDSHALTKSAMLKTMQDSGKIWQNAVEAGAESFVGFDRNICGYMMGMDWRGGNFSSRLWSATGETWERVREELARALANGQQPDITRRRIRNILSGYHNGNARGSGGLQYDVERIVRTEMAKASTNADIIRWSEMGVDKVQWNASFEAHTCEACGERDGRIYKLTELGDTIPLHPNCRCYFTPYDEVAEAVTDRTAEYKDADGNYQRIAWAPLNSIMERTNQGYILRERPIAIKDYFFSVSPFMKYEPARTGIVYKGEINKEFVDLAENTIQNAINQYPEIREEIARWYNDEITLHRGLSVIDGNKISTVGGWIDAGRNQFLLTYPAGLTGKVTKELQALASREYILGKWSSNKMNHTINHELGHLLANRLKLRGVSTDDFIRSVTGRRDLNKALKTLGKNISEYAGKNSAEAFAELFARSMAQDPKLNNKIVAKYMVTLEKTIATPIKRSKIKID